MTILFSKSNIEFNLDKFISGEKNKLLVIGYSGSGKTTLAKNLADKYGTKYVNLDDFFFNNQELKKENILLYKSEREKYELNKIFSSDRAVIEGVGIMRCPNEEIYGVPTIVIGTSLIVSSIRGAKRNIMGTQTNNSKLKEIITPLSKNLNKYHKLLVKHVYELQRRY